MKLIDTALFIKQTPLFEGLEFDTALSISDRLERINVDADEIFFSAGDSAAGLYFVYQGIAELNADGVIERLVPGDFFGDESLFSDGVRGYTCTARKPTTLLLLSRTHLFKILAEVPSVALKLLSLYAAHISLRPRSPFR
jgi:ATP-binding cassette subfamily B protein